MTDTACVSIYKLDDDYDIDEIRKSIRENMFYALAFKTDFQIANNIIVEGYARFSNDLPDWAKLIRVYLENGDQFTDIRKYSSIILIFIKDDPQKRFFVISGSNGASCIQNRFNYHFGINILERVFNSDLNKIDSVREKGIIGDVLASSRYYRRSRALAYEDDFGKYFQDLNLKLDESQIDACFPSIRQFKRDRLKPQISISCSASLELKMKVNLITVIGVINDIINLEAIEAPRIFNKSLVPLSSRRNKKEILLNYIALRKKIITKLKLNKINELDLDICPLEYEDYYKSSSLSVFGNDLHRNTKSRPLINLGANIDIQGLADLSFLLNIYNNCLDSVEFQNSSNKDLFIKQYISSIRIRTFDSDGELCTEGQLVDYIQTELHRTETYFLLDKTWYKLQSEFDASLTDKYLIRVGKRVRMLPFIKSWNGPDETAYNMLYDDKINPLYLHLIKVDHIELCDILVFDHSSKKTYIIHVKRDLGASIRDLVSQAIISARIIEEEATSGKKARIIRLYEQAVSNHRIDEKNLTKEHFISFFDYDREYCLALYDKDITNSVLESGDFSSRIAKFSLVEFSSVMNISGLKYSLINIPK